MLWAHCKGQMGACVPMCTGWVIHLAAWQGLPWVLSWKCSGQQDVLFCLSYERWCAGSIVCKELILLHDSALFIEQQWTEQCKMFLSLLCLSFHLPLHGSSPSPWWLLLQGCIRGCSSVCKNCIASSDVVASRNGGNNCTNILKSMWLQVNISSKVTCL